MNKKQTIFGTTIFVLISVLFLIYKENRTFEVRINKLPKYDINNVTGNGIFKGRKNNAIENAIIEEETENDEKEQARHCKIPIFPLFSIQVKSVYKKVSPVYCRGTKDWVVVEKGKVKINDHLVRQKRVVHCNLTFVERIKDSIVCKGKTKTLSSRKPKVSLESDFFWVECIDSEFRKWRNVMAGVHRNKNAVRRSKEILRKEKSEKLNVLMFGFDSTSRLNFIRQLPNSYKQLLKMNATVLLKYNIVGDGTPQALIPILTGFNEKELPETRRKKSNSTFVDVYPFIWKKFKENGYVTSWMEDGSSVGTFTYRLKGFKQQPTDHYGTPFDVAVRQRKAQKGFCLGSQTRFKVMLTYVRQLFDVYPDVPKFAFGFHSEYTHNSFNDLQRGDEELRLWLQELESSGILNNTILIVMADHGLRYIVNSGMRTSQQGKYEERLPFFSIVVPNWFESRFPNAVRNLRENGKDRLTTPYDIHATFITLLETLNNEIDVQENRTSQHHSKLSRNLSLFTNTSNNRTCEEAEIDAHWCTCLRWVQVNISDALMKRAAKTLVKYINSLTEEARKLCLKLNLKTIQKAEKMRPNSRLMSFTKSKDGDGRIPAFGVRSQINYVMYQIQVVTTPGDAVYEATLQYEIQNDSFEVSESHISRVNKYGDQPNCIKDSYPSLRKYCFCENK